MVHSCTGQVSDDSPHCGAEATLSSLLDDEGILKKMRSRSVWEALLTQLFWLLQTMLIQPAALTVRGVYKSLHSMAEQKGAGATARRKQIILHLLRSCRQAIQRPQHDQSQPLRLLAPLDKHQAFEAVMRKA